MKADSEQKYKNAVKFHAPPSNHQFAKRVSTDRRNVVLGLLKQTNTVFSKEALQAKEDRLLVQKQDERLKELARELERQVAQKAAFEKELQGEGGKREQALLALRQQMDKEKEQLKVQLTNELVNQQVTQNKLLEEQQKNFAIMQDNLIADINDVAITANQTATAYQQNKMAGEMNKARGTFVQASARIRPDSLPFTSWYRQELDNQRLSTLTTGCLFTWFSDTFVKKIRLFYQHEVESIGSLYWCVSTARKIKDSRRIHLSTISDIYVGRYTNTPHAKPKFSYRIPLADNETQVTTFHSQDFNVPPRPRRTGNYGNPFDTHFDRVDETLCLTIFTIDDLVLHLQCESSSHLNNWLGGLKLVFSLAEEGRLVKITEPDPIAPLLKDSQPKLDDRVFCMNA